MSSQHVLVIDDDDDVRTIARMSLEAVGGHQVRAADGGEEGIRLALESPPDAILLDMMMPGMDGPATLRLLQSIEETRHVPVVFLTAKVLGSDSQFTELGAAGLIAKPFDPMSLPGQLADIVGWD